MRTRASRPPAVELDRALGYRPPLDGLRAIAIVSVVAYHAFNWPRGGGDGVSLFFVLSGFLITTLLLEESQASGAVSLRSFYARRARRLLPGLAAMLAGFVLIAAAEGEAGYALRSVGEGGFYSENVLLSFWPHVMGFRNPVAPLWSLAQEEQFYLVWPLVLIFALRRFTLRSVEVAVRVAFLLVACEIGMLVATGATWSRIYFGPDTRTLELLAGVAIACELQRAPHKLVERALAPVGLGIFLAVECLINSNGDYPLAAVPVAIASMMLVLGVVTHPETLLARAIAVRPMVFVGKISYSLYLWNWLLLWATGHRFPVATVLASVAAASLSYRFVEQPFRRRRRRRLVIPEPAALYN